MNGVATPMARRPHRQRAVLARQHRLLVTVASVLLGLMVAYWWNRGAAASRALSAGSGAGAAAAAGDRRLPGKLATATKTSAEKAGNATRADGSGAKEEEHNVTTQQQEKQQPKTTAAASHKAAHQKQQQQQQQQQAQQQQAHVVHPGMEDEREWYSKLSAEACE